MKRAYVFVEGETDAEFLRKVLAPEAQRDVEFVVAGGGTSRLSLARSFLVRRRTPVAVFMDSDSLNPEVIEERQQSAEELIKAAAASIPAKVIVAVPEVEACFFAVPEVIEKVMGEKVPEQLIPLGLRDPQGVLNLLATTAKHKWDTQQAIGVMNAHDIERIRATAAIQELTAFLQSLPEMEPAGSTKS